MDWTSVSGCKLGLGVSPNAKPAERVVDALAAYAPFVPVSEPETEIRATRLLDVHKHHGVSLCVELR